MKYYIIAGEASGDLHGSNLMAELKKQDKNAEFRFWGGDLMTKQGGVLVKHFKEHSFMGFIEVLKNLGTIRKMLKLCKKDILNYRPDVVIFIDYPGFNLRIAKYVKSLNIKTFYYISPKVWAWKESRVKSIKKHIDKMFIILPFEIEFYAKHNYPVTYVGNPLMDAVSNKLDEKPNLEKFARENILSGKPIIGILPGSRKQEIATKLPVMLKLTNQYPDYQFVIAGAPSVDKTVYEKFVGDKDVKVLYGKTYDILLHSMAALVTSGTATLETALFSVPQVVCYIASPISYHIIRLILKLKYISLVNLIMDKPIVKELIQHEMNPKQLKFELDSILPDGNKRSTILLDYELLKDTLGASGASERLAKEIIKELGF